MARLERWIVASRLVPVLDEKTLMDIAALGANIGGGWCEVHQHIHITAENKEKVEQLLRDRGYTVVSATDPSVRHPDSGRFAPPRIVDDRDDSHGAHRR